ncbi:NACHT domain-containing protein [Chloroflexi bacterium TSY]|nr:NACHT domain-containing protein [Chloroflexi bacterium TSY]
MGKSVPIPLEGIYTDIYILDELTARQRFDIETLKEEFPPRSDRLHGQKRHNGLEVVEQSGNLFILGKPGAGKTTFLRYIALQAAKGDLNKFPIFITLKEWSKSQDLRQMILEQFDGYGFPYAEPFINSILREGEAIVLFDGLDEVNQEDDQRSELTQRLNRFSEQHPNTQCLITCRIAASDYQFPHFQEVEVADFTDEQVKTYVDKWFIDEPEKGQRFFKEFEKFENKGLKELASIPLLLSLLCLVFDDSMSFPKRQAELYEDASDALLRKWDSSRNIQRDTIYRGLSVKLKQRMFAAIAAESFEQGDYYLPEEFLKKKIEAHLKRVPPDDRKGKIDGVQILKAIEAQHGIFVERTRGIYSFSHLTLQEYFTAKYIVENATDGAVNRLITLERLADAHWRVVFLLTASLLYDASVFFIQFHKTIDDLIADDEALIALVCWAARKAVAIDAPYKLPAIRAFYLYLSFVLAQDFASYPAPTRSPDSDLDVSPDFDLDDFLDLDLTLDPDPAPTRSPDSDLDVSLDPAHIRYNNDSIARFLAQDLDRFLDRDLAHTDDLDYACSLAFDFARNYDLARGYELDRDLAGALDRTFDLSRALNLFRFLALDFYLIIALTTAEILRLVLGEEELQPTYPKYARYINDLAKLSQEANEPVLAAELKGLVVLDEKASGDDWKIFTVQLRTIVIQHRDIGHEYQWEKEQSDKINVYLQLNQFLIKCLKVSDVSNREEIENRILLPPE